MNQKSKLKYVAKFVDYFDEQKDRTSDTSEFYSESFENDMT